MFNTETLGRRRSVSERAYECPVLRLALGHASLAFVPRFWCANTKVHSRICVFVAVSTPHHPTSLSHVWNLSRETYSVPHLCTLRSRPLARLFSGLFTGMRQPSPTHVTSRLGTARQHDLDCCRLRQWRVKFKVSKKWRRGIDRSRKRGKSGWDFAQ